MEPYKGMLYSEDSKCVDRMMFNNGVAHCDSHPHNGKTFEELGDYLDTVEPLLTKIQAMAKPIPKHYTTMFRRTKPEHKAAEAADGKFDFQELYSRGFPSFVTAIYASDDPSLIVDFGEAEETLTLRPDALFIGGTDFGEAWDETMELLEEKGLETTIPYYDLYHKAGIDVCEYKDFGVRKGSWFNIYNPEVISSVT